ncbi:MAG: hypothetical protein U0575_05895 [Phycisphaerales bacterium]
MTCPPVALWDALPRGLPLNPWDVDGQGMPLPALGQGQNGIRLQAKSVANGTVFDLAWLDYIGAYQTWGDVAAAFIVPQVYAMFDGRRVWAHPALVNDAVIRIALDGPGGPALISGQTGTDASSSILFSIFLDGENSPPSWTGGINESFELVFTYAPGDEILLTTNALGNAEMDWAWWRDVRISTVPQVDQTGDGLVNGADLGVLLVSWGPCGGCTADINCDGVVDGVDLGALLGAWSG